MGTRRLVVAAAVWLLVGSIAQATVAPASRTNHEASASVADAMQMVQRTFEDIRHNDPAAAADALGKAMHLPGFAGLPESTRYQAVYVATLIASESDQHEKAHELAVQATGFANADSTAWMIRLSSAFATGDYADAAHSLTMFAQRWPGKLGDFLPGAIMQIHRQLERAHNEDADRAMLDELFDAGWKIQGVEPGDLWRDLALQHLQGGAIARATDVASRITSAQVALSMRVDKRFDPITAAHPDAFDVDRLLAAEITAAVARVRAHPDQLTPITDLQELYLIAGNYPEVLSISDAVVERVRAREGPKTWSDFSDRYNWILDNRSRAFQREGQWDKAIATGVLAARVPENGGMNVSQSINLGALYAELDQPDNATAAIIQIGDLSPMGQMQLEAVQLRIAVDRRDEPAASDAMDRLRKHRTDDVRTWQDALLLRGQLDEAAALLIERLENPSWRNDALVDMQHYAEVTRTPMEQIVHDRWNTITARPDVRAAMEKVGRVESFAITPGLR